MTILQNYSKKALAMALTMIILLSAFMVAGQANAKAVILDGIELPTTPTAKISVNQGDLVNYWVELTVKDANATPIVAWLVDVHFDSKIFEVNKDFANKKGVACGNAQFDYATGASTTAVSLPGGNSVISNLNQTGKVTIMDSIPMGSLGLEGKTTKLFCIQLKAKTSGTGSVYTELADVTNDDIQTVDIGSENFVQKYKVISTTPVKTDGYYVTGDIDLKLNKISADRMSADMPLQPGEYKIKLNNYGTLLGYSKTITDSTSGLTFKSTFSSFVTLKATGGVYNFQVNVATNTLVIKRTADLPKYYLTGDLHTVLSPVKDKPVAVGVVQLEKGTYKLKLSINNVDFGYGTTVNDKTSGSLSFSNKFSSSVSLVATGGTYTFTLFTETNKLQINYAPPKTEATNDVHISGDFSLKLDDNSGKNAAAVGTVTLDEGTYSFKVYNYGKIYTAGLKISDSGSKILTTTYSTPVTLIASGGKYKFTFNKTTGGLTIEKL